MEENIENKRERVKAQLDIMLNFIEQESFSFLSIGSLSIALIVILSLNKDLVSFDPNESKILLTIFLILIIVTLGTHLFFLNRGKTKSKNIIEEAMGKKIFSELKISLFEKVISYIPIAVTIIFFICISYIVYVLWR